MEKLIKRILNITVLTLAGISGIALLYFLFKGNAETGEGVIGLDLSMYLIYAMVFIVLFAMIVFALVQLFSFDKKQLIRTLILFVVAVLVVLVAYFIAPSELSDVAVRLDVSKSVYQWVGALMNVVYILLMGVILAFLGSFIYVKIKR